MSIEEYATAAVNEHDHRVRDEKGRVKGMHLMTDREISEETLQLLRGLSDGMQEIMQQVGPTMQAMQSGPLGKLFGGGR